MRESAIERHLVARVHKIGGLCLKFVSPGYAGVPDRIVLLPGGEVYWVELKTWTGRLSALQVRMHAWLKKLGQDVLVLRSTDQIDKAFPVEK